MPPRPREHSGGLKRRHYVWRIGGGDTAVSATARDARRGRRYRLVSRGAVPLGATQPALVGVLSRHTRRVRTRRLALALLALILFATHTYLGLGAGTMERIAAYPETLWLIIFGAYIAHTRRSMVTPATTDDRIRAR